MIYIIPVSHEVQARNPETYPWARDFLKYLKDKSLELKITFIAEEWSIDSGNDRGTNISNVKQVIDELEIAHKIIEPSIEARVKMGIPLRSELRKKHFPNYNLLTGLSKDQELFLDKEEAKYFPVREKYWLKIVGDKLNENMILICGGNHTSVGNMHLGNIVGFDSLLKDQGCNVKILTGDYYLNPYTD